MRVGDKVLWSSDRGYIHRYEIHTITRETKTRWILDNGERFTKDRLRKVGDAFGAYIEELTTSAQQRYSEYREDDLHKHFWRRIQAIDRPHHLSGARLAEIYNELCPPEGEQSESPAFGNGRARG